MFQSLVRDSAHSDWHGKLEAIADQSVSIPRSGFCPFRPQPHPLMGRRQDSFNPSFGILPIQTVELRDVLIALGMFQSLVRDSAHSDRVFPDADASRAPVSIPRSGFCPFRPERERRLRLLASRFQSLVRDSAHSDRNASRRISCTTPVSIPRSGFCPFRLLRSGARVYRVHGFNPSFGILPIQTLQSWLPQGMLVEVSIPRSGFCPFRQIWIFPRGEVERGFNPSFGILPIQTPS